MKRSLQTFLMLMLAAGTAKAQFSPYNYTVPVLLNRGAGNDSTANGVNGSYYESPRPAAPAVIGRFFPQPASSVPYRLRAISYQSDASFTLSGEKLTLKTSTGGLAKFAAYSIANATGVAKISFDLDLTQFTGIGGLTFAFGNTAGGGTINSTSNNTTGANAGIFASFRVVKSGNNLVTQFRSADGTANTNTSKYLIKAAESQRVEIFVNSTSNDVSYTYGDPAASVSLIANTYHVYVNGVRYDEEFPKVGTSYSESAINAFAINSATSTSTEYVGVSNLSIVYQTETNLPVSLTSFNAVKTQSGVQLKWQTASEQNNQYFDVLRSSDGKEFISIARVEGAGTSSVSKNYTFVDNSPLAGYNYYKLIQVDADGKATDYEDFVQVVNYGLDNNQNVFVFVAEQLLTVKAESESDANGSIEVYNTAGKLVLSQQVNVVKGNNQFNLDLGTLASGVYIVKADLGSKAEIVKVVK